MKKKLLLFFVTVFASVLYGAKGPKEVAKSASLVDITDGFVTTWELKTDGETIVIPININGGGIYNYSVNWGDGAQSTNQTADATHTYNGAGTYQVTITGTFPAIKFNSPSSSAQNAANLVSVDDWGDGVWNGMDAAFAGCVNLKTVQNVPGRPIFAPNSTLYSMFTGCSNLNCDLNNWDISNVAEIASMFYEATNFNGDVSSWNTSNITNMDLAFRGASAFNADISSWDVGRVENLSSMFSAAQSFNQDISGWNTASCVKMANMFAEASSFNQNLSSWNVSKVKDMESIFLGAEMFNGDLSGWDVSAVTTMGFMFFDAKSFNQNISSWDVSHVIDMSYMFKNATSFNQDISHWNTSALENGEALFNLAVNFNQDLGSWNVSKLSKAAAFFANSGVSKQNYESTLHGWATQDLKNGVVFGAEEILYCNNTDRQSIIDNYGWEFEDDVASCGIAAIPDGNGILYVDSSVTQAGDGSSWASPLKYLSDATSSVNENDAIKEIHIAKGTYYPTGDPSVVDRDLSFEIRRNGIKLIGGYAPGGGSRDVNLNKTILSGDIGIKGDTTDNSYGVAVMMLDTQLGTDSLILDGLNFTAGNAFRAGGDEVPESLTSIGGLTLSNPFSGSCIRNCNFYENYGSDAAALAVANMTIGGYNPLNGVLVENTEFRHNGLGVFTSTDEGLHGCIVANMGMPVLYKNCDFIENKSNNYGVATNYLTFDDVVFYNCNFLRNSSPVASAIGNVFNAKAKIINCLLADNVNLGGRDVQGSNNPNDYVSTDAVIANLQNCISSVINSTIVNNKSTTSTMNGAGVVYNFYESSVSITNSIIWGNASNGINGVGNSQASTVSYSLVENQAANAAMHLLDGNNPGPIFQDPANGDYRLVEGSVVIDAGLNDSLLTALNSVSSNLTEGGVDLIGNPRLDSAVDLGPFEYQSALPVDINGFNVGWEAGQAQLNWHSGVEVGIKAYEVEKSLNGKVFYSVATLKAKGSNQDYLYTTSQAESKAYYRIRAVDASGLTSYSPTRELSRTQQGSARLYPNPANNYIQLQAESRGDAFIYTANGIKVKHVQVNAGSNKIDISQLSAGVYFILVDGKKLSFVKE